MKELPHTTNLANWSGLLLLITVLFGACKPGYQIAYVESEQLEKQGQYFAHSNQDVQLVYDFWGDGGVLHFDLINRTNKLLFVHWDRSNIILNGAAYTFYGKEGIDKNTSGYLLSKDRGIDTSGNLIQPNTREKITRDKQPEQVPPNSRILSRTVPLEFDPVSLNKNETRRYGPDDSPYHIRTFVCYSLTPDPTEADLRFIDNSFYVTAIYQPTDKMPIDHRFPDRFYTIHDPAPSSALPVFVGLVALIVILGIF